MELKNIKELFCFENLLSKQILLQIPESTLYCQK